MGGGDPFAGTENTGVRAGTTGFPQELIWFCPFRVFLRCHPQVRGEEACRPDSISFIGAEQATSPAAGLSPDSSSTAPPASQSQPHREKGSQHALPGHKILFSLF